jgi:hypothetical protein
MKGVRIWSHEGACMMCPSTQADQHDGRLESGMLVTQGTCPSIPAGDSGRDPGGRGVLAVELPLKVGLRFSWAGASPPINLAASSKSCVQHSRDANEFWGWQGLGPVQARQAKVLDPAQTSVPVTNKGHMGLTACDCAVPQGVDRKPG